MSATARALYLSKTCRGASAFLQAVPTDRHLLLSNDTMHTALRVRFQISVLSDQGVRHCSNTLPLQSLGSTPD
eukprot:m.316178 g.316178  ORF g.316178 m.316178 type:complete len:73 (+) comp55459_c0_seq1:1383-1601(+)